jgi:hypothetical protein
MVSLIKKPPFLFAPTRKKINTTRRTGTGHHNQFKLHGHDFAMKNMDSEQSSIVLIKEAMTKQHFQYSVDFKETNIKAIGKALGRPVLKDRAKRLLDKMQRKPTVAFTNKLSQLLFILSKWIQDLFAEENNNSNKESDSSEKTASSSAPGAATTTTVAGNNMNATYASHKIMQLLQLDELRWCYHLPVSQSVIVKNDNLLRPVCLKNGIPFTRSV